VAAQHGLALVAIASSPLRLRNAVAWMLASIATGASAVPDWISSARAGLSSWRRLQQRGNPLGPVWSGSSAGPAHAAPMAPPGLASATISSAPTSAGASTASAAGGLASVEPSQGVRGSDVV
jgi:hypothetical protein